MNNTKPTYATIDGKSYELRPKMITAKLVSELDKPLKAVHSACFNEAVLDLVELMPEMLDHIDIQTSAITSDPNEFIKIAKKNPKAWGMMTFPAFALRPIPQHIKAMIDVMQVALDTRNLPDEFVNQLKNPTTTDDDGVETLNDYWLDADFEGLAGFVASFRFRLHKGNQ